ncbi:MAG: hypothetical protein KC776_05120 [Myxococcales bacterium]|nr:hypothetical protein [Myxococcales bacterium]MCB9575606.1 hypothetical protein [Polyangiaceae bacterium]
MGRRAYPVEVLGPASGTTKLDVAIGGAARPWAVGVTTAFREPSAVSERR